MGKFSEFFKLFSKKEGKTTKKYKVNLEELIGDIEHLLKERGSLKINLISNDAKYVKKEFKKSLLKQKLDEIGIEYFFTKKAVTDTLSELNDPHETYTILKQLGFNEISRELYALGKEDIYQFHKALEKEGVYESVFELDLDQMDIVNSLY